MEIGVISDTHGSLYGWERSWEILKNSEILMHCGDIFYHGVKNPIPEKYSPIELLNIFNNLNIPVLISKGNCDSDTDQKYLNIPMSFPFFLCCFNNIKIIVSHGDIFNEESWLELGKKWKINILISGHTHKPVIKRIENIILLNPGSPSIPLDKVPTCAKIDLKGKKVKIYNLIDFSIFREENL